MAKKYRCYRIFREQPTFLKKQLNEDSCSRISECRYISEIFDVGSSKNLVNQNYCEILMVHMKLLKSKEHLQDIEQILDEVDVLREAERNKRKKMKEYCRESSAREKDCKMCKIQS